MPSVTSLIDFYNADEFFVVLLQTLFMTQFKCMRLFLFFNSYSGMLITKCLTEKYKSAQLLKAIKRLSQIIGISDKELRNAILLNSALSCPYKRMPSKIKIYLEVEYELKKLVEEKLDEYSTAKEDYQRQLLYPAIERAVGNLLTDVKNDDRFQVLMEDKFKQACYAYYKVVYKYKLPTLRTVPFVLRLIT